MFGPETENAKYIYKEKYFGKGETYEEFVYRLANGLKEDDNHYHALIDIIGNQRFLFGGRIQSAIGSPRQVTAMNCYVSMTIPDSMDGIMQALSEGAQTMRMGGGIGYDFSTLRPRGAYIKSLDSHSSGPLAFMDIFSAMCGAISSAGHRRGAQMGVMRVDHPDIEEFITAKQNDHRLLNFNISVAVTDEFMQAVKEDGEFDLVFEDVIYKTIKARPLWDKIMRATWDYAEPGVLFIDRINKKNNLRYCELIAATNPCAEQPLPPYGACLLGSINLTKYIVKVKDKWEFDYKQLIQDIPNIVLAMDNVIDRTIYPLENQKENAINKRRMGIGVTGAANAIEAMGHPYGSKGFLSQLEVILLTIRDAVYMSSVELAKEKGSFPLFEAEKFLESDFALTLPLRIRNQIRSYGIRNSHLLSIAPTGTISLAADNISSGIEPVFSVHQTRKIREFDTDIEVNLVDYGYEKFGVTPLTSENVTAQQHVDVLNLASRYVDSAVSKTCNVGDDVTWDEFKDIYMKAYDGGASGCTTFRASGKRFGILVKTDPIEAEGTACYIDKETGRRTCE